MAGIIERYKKYYESEVTLPNHFEIISIEEGNTPLIPAPNLAKLTQVEGLKVFLKYEGANPTGSFKDRGMTFAVSMAKTQGAQTVICASTGNTSASAAAYASRAGLRCVILLPQGKVALGKLSQAILYGAEIIEIEGNFDQALDAVRVVGQEDGVAIVNSINPYRIISQRTGAYEICDQLGGKAPDYHFIPVGNAGNITAYWQGYKAYQADGKISQLPKMMGYQALGASPIVQNKKVDNPETIATAIRIGNPASWEGATTARDESGGVIEAVSDDEIMAAYSKLASLEGVFCEPASAASVAGLLKAACSKALEPSSTVVCVLTGNGLKDPDNAIAYGKAKKISLKPDFDLIAEYVKG